MDRRIIAAASAALALGGLTTAANAASYASGITQSGTIVSFTLNESITSGDVIVYRDGVPTSLGGLAKGTHSFDLGTAANYSIAVKNAAAVGGFTQAEDALIAFGNKLSDDSRIWQF